MFSGETRLHFEGVLDKHGKRFFEVGLLMFWKFNIKMYWYVISCETKCFSYCKEGYIKWIHRANFRTLQLWSFMIISEKNRTNNNLLRYNSLNYRDERSAGVDIKLGDLMITPSKSLWKIICVWYLILNCLLRTGLISCKWLLEKDISAEAGLRLSARLKRAVRRSYPGPFCGLLRIKWQLKTDRKHRFLSALDMNV